MSSQWSRSAATRPARSASVATTGCGAVGGELGCLVLGERGPERREPDVGAAGGEGHGVRVHRSFDQHGCCAGGKQVRDRTVELVALVEQGRGGGVEVFRAGVWGVIGEGGVATADEPEDVPALGVEDGKQRPVAEPVDQPAVPGGGGESGFCQFGVADPTRTQVVDQVGPTLGGVTRADVGVPGDVDTEAFSQVGPRPPRASELVLVVVLGHRVDLGQAQGSDGGGFFEFDGAGDHPFDLGVRGSSGPIVARTACGERQVGADVNICALGLRCLTARALRSCWWCCSLLRVRRAGMC